MILSFSLAQFGRDVAAAYLDSFEEVWSLLSRHPEAGAMFRSGKVEVRSYPCRSHRIFYVIEGEVVWIIRILHRARNSDRVMREWLNRSPDER